MIGLDTNILVRYIAQDDAIQSPKATALIEQLRCRAGVYLPRYNRGIGLGHARVLRGDEG